MSDRAPDIIGPVIAYRAWRVTGDRRLRSMAPLLGALTLWRPGEDTHASCFGRGMMLGNATHDAPAPDCRCGIYAMHTVDDMLSEGTQVANLPRDASYSVVAGEVEVWGRSERYERGRRVEWCRVRGLYAPRLTGDVDVNTLAEIYGVPVLDDPDGKIAAWREREPVEVHGWRFVGWTSSVSIHHGRGFGRTQAFNAAVQHATATMRVNAQDFADAMEKMAQSMRDTERNGATPTMVIRDEGDPDKPIPSRRKDHLSFTADHHSPRSIKKKGVRNGRPR